MWGRGRIERKKTGAFHVRVVSDSLLEEEPDAISFEKKLGEKKERKKKKLFWRTQLFSGKNASPSRSRGKREVHRGRIGIGKKEVPTSEQKRVTFSFPKKKGKFRTCYILSKVKGARRESDKKKKKKTISSKRSQRKSTASSMNLLRKGKRRDFGRLAPNQRMS